MGDMAEVFNAMREDSKERRARNRDSSARILAEAGMAFESKNNGAHLVVEGRYDFWPGTGLWMARGEKTKRRGVKNLIQRIKCDTAQGRE